MLEMGDALRQAIEDCGFVLLNVKATQVEDFYYRIHGSSRAEPFASTWLDGATLTLHGHTHGKTTYDLNDSQSLDLFFERLKSLARRAGLRPKKAGVQAGSSGGPQGAGGPKTA